MFSNFSALVQGSNLVYFVALNLLVNYNAMGHSRALLRYPNYYEALKSHPSGTEKLSSEGQDA